MIARALPIALFLMPVGAQEPSKPTALQKQITKLVQQCFGEDVNATDRAAAQLAALGIHAALPFVDGYLRTGQQFHDHGVMKRTLLAMGAGAEPGITRLIDEFLEYRKETCFKCMELLSEVAPWSPQFARLMEAVDLDKMQTQMRSQGVDFDAEFYELAWFALDERTSIDPKAATADLIEYLGDSPLEKPFATIFVIDLLAHRRAEASDAIPLLATLHSQPQHSHVRNRITFSTHHEFRRATARALLTIAPADARSLDAMAWLLKSSNQHDKLAAIAALGRIAVADDAMVTRSVVAVLTRHLAGYWRREITVNTAAVITLGNLGRQAKSAHTILDEMDQTIAWDDGLEAAVRRALAKSR